MTRTDADRIAAESSDASDRMEIVTPREVPLGGPRAMTVRRTLPNRDRTTIGPWCFLDHYGPDPVTTTGGMLVAPHPHTGLQTVSWLFEGTIQHRDSTGSDALVVPGELNLMTAGAGIQHSEVSTPGTTTLHGVQLWVALPDEHRQQEPHFDVRESVVRDIDGVRVQLITGHLADVGTVDAPAYWPMVAAQIDFPAGHRLALSLVSDFEYGLLVDRGDITVEDCTVSKHHLGYLAPGSRSISMAAGDEPSRVLLIGGKPFEEELVMWWNFIGRDHEEIVALREEWQAGLEMGSARFGHLPPMEPLPAPEMPGVRLKSRPPSRRD